MTSRLKDDDVISAILVGVVSMSVLVGVPVAVEWQSCPPPPARVERLEPRPDPHGMSRTRSERRTSLTLRSSW